MCGLQYFGIILSSQGTSDGTILSVLYVLSCSVMSHCLQLHVLSPTRFLYPWDFPGKNPGVGCHLLLQGIFLTQGQNPHLLHWQVCSFTPEPLGKPFKYYYCLVTRSCLTLVTPWTVAHQAPLSLVEFSRQEYWSGFPFYSPGDPPDPGIEARSA